MIKSNLIWSGQEIDTFIKHIFGEQLAFDEVVMLKLTSRKKYGKNIDNCILSDNDLSINICHTIDELISTITNYEEIKLHPYNINQLVIYIQLNTRSTIKTMFELNNKINEYASKLILLDSNDEKINIYNKIKLLDIEHKSLLMKSKNRVQKYSQIDIDFKDNIELEYQYNGITNNICGMEFVNRFLQYTKFLGIVVKFVIETKNGYHIIFLNNTGHFDFYNLIKSIYGNDFLSKYISKKINIIDYIKDGYCQIPGTFQAGFPAKIIYANELSNGINYVDHINNCMHNTCCMITANYIFKMLTSDDMTIEKIINDSKSTILFDNQILFHYPEMDNDIVRKRESDIFWSTNTENIIHNIYMLSFDESIHNTIIEKYSSHSESYWIVYQSWKHEYTIIEWLGLKESNSSYKKIIDTYGKFKKLTIDEMKMAFTNSNVFGNISNNDLLDSSNTTLHVYVKSLCKM